jgi:predicted DCC family thiol-disulfide oxidoreductase YuxK
VRFVLRHDRRGRFRFAALQSRFAAEALARHTRDPRRLDTMYLLLDTGTPNERLLGKSDGLLAVLRELGGFWRVLALARVLPLALRDRGYDVLARNRYRWFGRYDACPIPPPDVRQRFAARSEDEQEIPDVARVSRAP